MALDPKLLEILACPEDKGPLLYFADEDALYNPRLKRRYAIQDDIPIMLIDEAVTVSPDEDARLLAKAEAAGIKPTFDPADPAWGGGATAAPEPADAAPAADAASADAAPAADPADPAAG